MRTAMRTADGTWSHLCRASPAARVMFNGRVAACLEEKFVLSEPVARLGDILNTDTPLVEIGRRSLFPNLAVGRRQ